MTQGISLQKRAPRLHGMALVAGMLFLLPGAVLTPLAGEAQEKVFSGPQPGEKITPFRVLQISGTAPSKEVKILDTGKGSPTFLLFLHKVTEPAIGLMMPLDFYAKKFEGLESHYVFLTGDRAQTEERARRWSGSLFSGSTLSISLDGAEGPGKYGLNRNVTMTVLVAKDNKVVANFAIIDPNNRDAPGILAEIAKVMGEPAPSYEKIREELNARRTKQREMKRMENPVVKLSPDPVLGKIMLGMIYTEVRTEEHFKKVAAEMQKWAGKDAEKKAALARYSKAVLDGRFGMTEAARKILKKLAKKQED